MESRSSLKDLLSWDGGSDSDSDELPDLPDPKDVGEKEYERLLILHGMPYSQAFNELLAEYKPTPENPNPKKLNGQAWPPMPAMDRKGNPASPVSLLSKFCDDYKLGLAIPHLPLSNRSFIVSMCNNYNYRTGIIDIDLANDMTQLIQSEFELDVEQSKSK